jgi:hypothetical protein
MKHIAVRTFVLVLAVAGFSASSVFSASASEAKTNRPNIVLAGGPAPLCPPVAGGTLCGIH